ncbi:protein lin-54 homolog isoform X1 [Amphibalanus amphitrite]|uniref:protein lin-54 homolog isoform X1 n=1 Tax=Amphibalanus amphitrite TaxID=1232801 RepID=UPI001C9082CA|nr:protein lin-54 homolog isoform X1 [Amphibalanus amphitrite]XP_043205762.1 protein lin-54 homolog isoform X1 [Amphibalanus amphitrite]XP_043205763.1 protein lin-54 homolog isoform X1 [Amphibalanus amphitrite]XP_043205764.1 protein lin-54 homolog isoform X1 [Amphibalanus amphitrite]XP_043205765.1 protein lin-54 homolog isoform X1 [Amphibalanus amphitrite]XP_043205766.1 protein lin-54 homolog isoform X1 [Amphibalanus amphitrite]XP_043205767.1 protein lin-54 homolog isoform X1 [Amphibalanus am
MEAMDFDPETLLTSTSSDPMLGKPADPLPASATDQQGQPAPSGSFVVLQSGNSPGAGPGGVTQLGNISVSSLAPGQGARAAASRVTAVMGRRAAGTAPGSLTKYLISPGQQAVSTSAPVRMMGSTATVRVAAPPPLQLGASNTITLTSAEAQRLGIFSPKKLTTLEGVKQIGSPTKRIVVRSSPGQQSKQGGLAAAAAAGAPPQAPFRVLTQSGLPQAVGRSQSQPVQFVRVVGSSANQPVFSAPPTATAGSSVKIAIAPGGRIAPPPPTQRLLLPAAPVVGSSAQGGTIEQMITGAEYSRPRPMMHTPARLNRPAPPTRVPKPPSTHMARAAARGSDVQIRPRKPCNCTKSQCLKLYCDCFASGEFCNNCNCTNCFNSLDREEERQRAIRACLDRNPFAFKPKIGKSDNETRKHQKGCNCKKSGCLKNYCECYEAKIFCSTQCKCMGCKNYESANTRPPRPGAGSGVSALEDSLSLLPTEAGPSSGRGPRRTGGLKVATFPVTEKAPAAVRVTQDVISATLSCLMTEAALAGDTAEGQQRVLREFGRCLSEIIDYGSRRREASAAVPGVV